MNCSEVRVALSAYVDDELSAEQSQQLERHIHTCPACSRDHHELLHLRDMLGARELNTPAPVSLQVRVSEDLKQDARHRQSPFFSRGHLAVGLPALLLGLLLGWGAMSYVDTRQSQDDVPGLLASAHIRSLMAQHLTDITSSDSHTVKPWFHGRLDFSPAVYDLAGQGFPLLGGRLEYFAGGPVAALVYRHRQHPVNLFVSPRLNQSAGMKAAGYKGYNILGWSDGSLAYWLVSDLNLSDLQDFKAMFINQASLQGVGDEGAAVDEQAVEGK